MRIACAKLRFKAIAYCGDREELTSQPKQAIAHAYETSDEALGPDSRAHLCKLLVARPSSPALHAGKRRHGHLYGHVGAVVLYFPPPTSFSWPKHGGDDARLALLVQDTPVRMCQETQPCAHRASFPRATAVLPEACK